MLSPVDKVLVGVAITPVSSTIDVFVDTSPTSEGFALLLVGFGNDSLLVRASGVLAAGEVELVPSEYKTALEVAEDVDVGSEALRCDGESSCDELIESGVVTTPVSVGPGVVKAVETSFCEMLLDACVFALRVDKEASSK